MTAAPDSKTHLSIKGLLHCVEVLLGRPLPDAHKLCHSDFRCLGDKLTVGEVVLALSQTLRTADCAAGALAIDPDWWPSDAESMAELVRQVAHWIAAPREDAESLEIAIGYVLTGLHTFLKKRDLSELPDFTTVYIHTRAERLLNRLRPGLTQAQIDDAVATAKEIEAASKAKGGTGIFRFFPSAVEQNEAFIRPRSVDPATRDTHGLLLTVLCERHEADGQILRTSKEFDACRATARARYEERQRQRATVEQAVRTLLDKLGAPKDCPINFEHQIGDRLVLADNDRYAVQVSEGPGGIVVLMIAPGTGGIFHVMEALSGLMAQAAKAHE